MLSQQLSFKFSLNDHAAFANYIIGDNEAVVHALKQAISEKTEHNLYLFGEIGVGKSHILQACCHYATECGLQAVYLPLAECLDFTAEEVLFDLEKLDVVCIDNLEVIATNRLWQEALFHFYNRISSLNHVLISAGAKPMGAYSELLPDLRSRLAQGINSKLHSLTDEQIVEALILRAYARGMDLSAQVAEYLVRRLPRHMPAMLAALERLDQRSLQLQRRLTIPFVRDVLSSYQNPLPQAGG